MRRSQTLERVPGLVLAAGSAGGEGGEPPAGPVASRPRRAEATAPLMAGPSLGQALTVGVSR